MFIYIKISKIFIYQQERAFYQKEVKLIMEYNITYREKNKGIQVIVSYKDNEGKWKQKTRQGFDKKATAKRAADSIIEEIKEACVNGSRLDSDLTGITLREFSEMYFETKALHCEENSLLAYKRALDSYSELMDMPMEKVTSINVQKIINRLQREGKSYTTIKFYTDILKSIFKAAVSPYKAILENPFTVKFEMPKVKVNKKIRALNKAEMDDLLYKIKKPSNFTLKENNYLISLIAGTMGLRIGEILGLCEDDIDFNKSVCRVNKQWKRLKNDTFGFGSVKSKNSNRMVPIPKSTLKEIQSYIDHQKVKDLSKRIFWDEVSTGNAAARLRRLYIARGYNISVHDLRHTYASLLVANGENFKTVASLIGDTVQMVMNTYSHMTEDMFLMAKKTIENIF